MNIETQKRKGILYDVLRALILAMLPLILLMLMWILSPEYVQFFFNSGSFGSSVIGIILLSTLVTFPPFLGGLRVIRSGRIGLGIALMVLPITLLVLPACLLVIFTPVAIQIMQQVH